MQSNKTSTIKKSGIRCTHFFIMPELEIGVPMCTCNEGRCVTPKSFYCFWGRGSVLSLMLNAH